MGDLRIQLKSECPALFEITCEGSNILLDLTDKTSGETVVPMPEDGTLTIVNRFPSAGVETAEKAGLFKKTAAVFLFWIHCALSYENIWYYPYTVRETVTLQSDGDGRLNLTFCQPDPTFSPEYRVIGTQSDCRPDFEEWDAQYAERKKAQNLFGLIPTAIAAGISLLSACFQNITTAVFTAIIAAVFLGCFLYARHLLKKKWRSFRQKNGKTGRVLREKSADRQ
ncbi:MAG: hypothetical protein ACI3XR_02445 [Eubacteriales bacterium]